MSIFITSTSWGVSSPKTPQPSTLTQYLSLFRRERAATLGTNFYLEDDMQLALSENKYQESILEGMPDQEVYREFETRKAHLRKVCRSWSEFDRRVKELTLELGI